MPTQQAFVRYVPIHDPRTVNLWPGVRLGLLFCTPLFGPASAAVISDSHPCKVMSRVATVCRCLSARVIAKELERYEAERADGGNKSTYWIVFELLWRDYFRFACGMGHGHVLAL